MSRIAASTILLLALVMVLVACSDEEPTSTPAPPTEAAPEPAEETAPPTTEAGTEEDQEVVSSTPEVEPVAEDDPIYLSMIWHQHQPVYFKDPETGVYVRPWVRAHAAKDYVDMAAILDQYPDINATFNLTPSLIRQLDDLAAGAKDLYWTHTEIPASDLTDEQKQFILDQFFDINRGIIARFPRYQELLQLRDNSDDPISAYSTQDFLDLQLLFNLAWTDPDWLAQEPLASLVEKGREFEEADKAIVLGEHLRLIQEVIPIHKRLQDEGRIEITMTPFAHPILPLLYNTDLAREALPDVELPGARFTYGADAVAQVERGVELYKDHFGQAPRGMWPAEGSVAQEIVTMVAQNDIQWMASDEGVLANSLGFDNFTRNSNEVVVEADQLYRPYYVEGRRGGPVAMVFRDVIISDLVGFIYSGMEGEVAAQDFVDRIHAIREELKESGAEGPHLVSVILDGENAWEYYENDGKEFLHSLYQMLSDDPLIETVTPSEFLEIAPDQPEIDDLWAGSWISHDYSTWIGEEEENRGWELLVETRDFLQQYIGGDRQGRVSDEVLEEALVQMYIAEGSDWFWWYGSDQNSGNDDSFDQQYRNTLKQVYLALGEEPPSNLDVPIIPEQAVAADIASTGLITPTIDGVVEAGEWDAAGVYGASGRAMAAAQPYLESLAYGFDAKNLYLKTTSNPEYETPEGESTIEIYMQTPGSASVNSFSRNGSLLGFPSNNMLAITLEDGLAAGSILYVPSGSETWAPVPEAGVSSKGGEGVVETAIFLEQLGKADTGDRMTMRVFYRESIEIAGELQSVDMDRLPGMGPAVIGVPDLGTTTILIDITDPNGDDTGPGTYTYPSDAVFSPGNFDITNFQVGFDEENIVFRFVMRGPVDNSWDSPNGVSLQTFDVYIDSDGDGQGGVGMLPGRNLSFDEGTAWDYAITVEGWFPGVFVPGDEGPLRIAEASEFQVLADPGQQKVTIRIPKAILGEDPENWHYAAVVMGQEGYPSGGVMRVRDVTPVGEQWRIGGAPAGATNHTRVIDLAWGNPGDQEAWLSNFEIVDAPQGQLTDGDYARVPMFGVQD
ncbi:MAG TPA: glucodextranase DOMON-like domain-containing protein [candidate division Zixibacteria bacterium]|nr:glucodextranase DOMON-like domain-containing protein [candidate division Zixibacteria bacterium]